MKKKLFFRKSVSGFTMILATLFIFSIGNHVQATHVHLYLDSVGEGSETHYCKTSVDTVLLHKPAGSTLTNWYCNGAIYYIDPLPILNTDNSGIIFHGSSITKTIHIFFDNPIQPLSLHDSVYCGITTVTLNAGNEGSHILWSTSDTNQSITTDVNGLYWVNVWNACGTITDSANLSFVHLEPQICYVDYDTLSYKNNIYFPESLYANPQCESIKIYKEVSSNVWNLIGTVPADSSYFTDLNCDPQAQSYSYSIATVDTCGNLAPLSGSHTTITLLSAYNQGTDIYGFTWSSYIGVFVSNYFLYGINASGAIALVGTVNGNQYFYNYVNPNPAYAKYFVGFTAPNCSAKSSSLVRSNYVQSTIGIAETADIDNLFSVYPNPVKDNLKIQTELIIQSLTIADITGRKLISSDQKNIDCSILAKGIYQCIFITEDGRTGSIRFVKD
jgi:hypothetical protein